MKRRLLIVLMGLALAACGSAPATTTAPADSATAALQTGLNALATTDLAQIDAAVNKNDAKAAQAAFESLHEDWEVIEDGVKDVSADSYKTIEDALEGVEDVVVRAGTLNATDAKAATAELRSEIEKFAGTLK